MERVKSLQNQLVNYLDIEAKSIGQTAPFNLYQPIDYTLNMGGKRLRPVMVLLAAELFGGKAEDRITSYNVCYTKLLRCQ